MQVGSECECSGKVISSLGYSKRCPRWVPQMLIPEQKDHLVTINQELLKWYEAKGNTFLDQIITGHKTWCHYYELEFK